MSSASGVVLRGALHAQRGPIAMWALAVSVVAAVYAAFYPSVGGAKMGVVLESMPPDLVSAMGLDAMATASGYVSATVYALLGAILVLVCAAGLGARLVAGHEEDGTLELELTGPTSRRRVYLERLAVLWVTVLSVVAALTLTLTVVSFLMGLGLRTTNLIAAGAGLTLFAGAIGSLAFAAGAATGRRAAGLAVATVIAVGAYLLGYLGPLVGSRWMTQLSPYHWYIGSDPVAHGVDWGGLGLLALLAAGPLTVGAVLFGRRDLMV